MAGFEDSINLKIYTEKFDNTQMKAVSTSFDKLTSRINASATAVKRLSDQIAKISTVQIGRASLRERV